MYSVMSEALTDSVMVLGGATCPGTSDASRAETIRSSPGRSSSEWLCLTMTLISSALTDAT